MSQTNLWLQTQVPAYVCTVVSTSKWECHWKERIPLSFTSVHYVLCLVSPIALPVDCEICYAVHTIYVAWRMCQWLWQQILITLQTAFDILAMREQKKFCLLSQTPTALNPSNAVKNVRFFVRKSMSFCFLLFVKWWAHSPHQPFSLTIAKLMVFLLFSRNCISMNSLSKYAWNYFYEQINL